MTASTMASEMLGFDAMYAAVMGRDVRYDGVFYTAVRTTGVYCRPSCPARKPLRHNVTFYRSAAAAQAGGYRACLRCRPESLPGSEQWDSRGSLSSRALELIDRGVVDDEGVDGLARRLGWSSRTVSRVLVEQTGAGPLTHARARRARVAHELITGSGESFTDIAFAAGFGSVRSFNETVQVVYGASPSQLRGSRRTTLALGAGTLRANLKYRPPFDWEGLLTWFGARALPGFEEVTGRGYRVGLALPHGHGSAELVNNPERHRVEATLTLVDLRDYGAACVVVRRLFDLDADPVGISGHLSSVPGLGSLATMAPGTRIPGTPTPVEALVRALTGQQVSVAAGLAQLRRLTDHTHGFAFPDAEAILNGGLGWFRGPVARRATLEAALEFAASGNLDLGHDPVDITRNLHEIRGIGPWTIAYTLMRGYGAPDVDLSGDAAVINAAQRLTNRPVDPLLHAARPWRSYAALHLWRDQSAPSAAASSPDERLWSTA